MAVWDRFQTFLFGGAIGAAASAAITPQIEPARQLAWSNNAVRILGLGSLAELVAEGVLSEGDVADLVARNGYQVGSLRALAEIALSAPDLALLMQSRRRGDLTIGEFNEGLAKLKIKPEFRPAIRELLEQRLSPADVANAVQQGFVPTAGLLPDDPGGSPPFTPPIEEVDLNTLAEFQAGGVPSSRAKVLAQLVGLPPGPMELLDMWRRGIITETAVERGIREGHTKTKWTSALKALRWRIIPGREVAGLWLRGWLTEPQAKALGKLDGWDAEAMELLYKNRGRPATTRQVHIGYARGGTLPGAANEKDAFGKAVAQSNIRTEYTDLLWASRYSYPSAFVIRGLTQAGTFNRDQAEQILIESGWPPQYAKLAADDWAGLSGAGTEQRWASRARSSAFSAAWSDYLDGNAEDDDFRAVLETLGAATTEQDIVLQMANVTRTRTRRDLTQAQILKLYKKSIWTRDQAQTALEDLGMEAADAGALLDAV